MSELKSIYQIICITVSAVSLIGILIVLWSSEQKNQTFFNNKRLAIIECSEKVIKFDPDSNLTTAYYTECLAKKGFVN